VQRQSSSCGVGKPTSQKRAKASSRNFASQPGSAMVFRKFSKAVKYVSSCSVAVITFYVVLGKSMNLVVAFLARARGYFFHVAVAGLFQLQRQFLSAGAYDAAIH